MSCLFKMLYTMGMQTWDYVITEVLFLVLKSVKSLFLFLSSFQSENVDVFRSIVSPLSSTLFSRAVNKIFPHIRTWQPIIAADCPWRRVHWMSSACSYHTHTCGSGRVQLHRWIDCTSAGTQDKLPHTQFKQGQNLLPEHCIHRPS